MKSSVFSGYTVYENGDVYTRYGKKMASHDNGRGYQIVWLTLPEGRKVFAVHRLVALCFVANPNNLPEVNHIDGDKLNNHYSNLEWVTRGQNIKHAFDNNLRNATGENNARCMANEDTVKEICTLLESGLSPAQIRDLGYKYGLIRGIKRGKNWKHISKNYTF